MKNLIYAFLCLSIFISPIFRKPSKDVIPIANYNTSEDEINILLDNVNNNYDIPEESTSVYNLPWKNEVDFLRKKEKHDTPFLMAGYCAVLSNPLPGEEYNVRFASKKAKGLVIKPGEIFSQNMSIGPYTKLKGYKEGASYIGGDIIMTEGGGVCKMATTLYNLAVLSNLEIIERHNHSMPVNYVPNGQDATVAYGIKDFRFKNTTKSSILIWSQMIDNRLYIGFYGNERPPKISWQHEVSNITKPYTKYINNEEIPKGEIKVISQGINGSTVKSTVKILYNQDHYTIKNMGISKYLPLPRVIYVN